MEAVIRTGFKVITHNINFNPQGIVKGKALAVCHVCPVQELTDANRNSVIMCSVIRQTSVTLPPYKVKLEVNPTRHVTDVSCDCVSRAAKKCKHVYALIHYINTDRSVTKTSQKQVWGKPSDRQLGKDLYSKPMIVTEHYKVISSVDAVPPPAYNLTFKDVARIPCALQSLLREKNRSAAESTARRIVRCCIDNAIDLSNANTCKVCSLNLVIFAEENGIYTSNSAVAINENCKNFYTANVKLMETQVVELCVLTQKQADCEEWFSARKLRISASSKAHKIKTRKTKTVDSLLKDFFSNHTFTSSAMDYGKKNKRIAVADNERRYNVIVVHIGLLVLLPQPWLCASPDGVVVDDGCISKILEVKCPSSCVKQLIVDPECGTCNVPYVYLEDEILELKESHQYYTQIQVQMYVTVLTECDLFVWSPLRSCRVNVHRDEGFIKQVIPMLEKFYFTSYLVALSEREKENRARNSV